MIGPGLPVQVPDIRDRHAAVQRGTGQVVVAAGQHVVRGQVIMLMGSTGFSTGPHVHYEVHVNGQRVNPISYL